MTLISSLQLSCLEAIHFLAHGYPRTGVTQSQGQQGANTMVPINIRRCQHRAGNFSGCSLRSDVLSDCCQFKGTRDN